MSGTSFDDFLQQTLDDRHLSRGERQTMLKLLSDETPSDAVADRIRHRALQLAKGALSDSRDREILTWFYNVVKGLDAWQESASKACSTALTDFSPGNEPRARIIGLIDAARTSIDCCVFTITDNRITDALLRAHERGIKVRIISDDRKAEDRGSDVDDLAHRGLAVRLDKTAAHMHHKFSLFDRGILLTGSYNWTLSAARENHENVVVTDDVRFVRAFNNQFETLWFQLGDGHRSTSS